MRYAFLILDARGFSRSVATILLAVCVVHVHGQAHWVVSWACSQQLVEPQNSIPEDDLHDLTLRQVVHLSIGGSKIRIRLSNRFGTSPLLLDHMRVARAVAPDSDRIAAGDKPITFFGAAEVIIPAGADYVSDDVVFPVPPLSDLSITLHVAEAPATQTGHPGARATSYLAHEVPTSAAELPTAKKIEHWYFLTAIEVEAPAQATAIAVLGDSITDGHGATTNGNDRWPDVLARRLQQNALTRQIAILNHGIGGNRLLLDGIGPNALARFDHDVISQSGVRYLIVLEGINDIGMLARTHDVPDSEHEALVDRMEAAYQQIITRAHEHRITVIGATLLPFVGSNFYHPSPRTEADRQAVNQWIRAKGHFDAVVDFDRLMRDPQDKLLPQFDSGDHLHPSPAGYAAMANAVPLKLFARSRAASVR